MSESLLKESVANQLASLATLAGANCSDFQHQVIDSSILFAGPGEQQLIAFTVADNSGVIVTSIDIKTLFDTTDATLGSGAADWRSTDDLNPYGPFAVGSGGVGTIRITIAGENQFATAWDIGLINNGILFSYTDVDSPVVLLANPNQPAGKNLQLVTRMNTFIVPGEVATLVKKNQTRIVTQ
jgi:hypothetical protein